MSGAVNPTGAAALRRFKPYPAYKDSGVEWLGQIPAHWKVKRLKLVAELNPPASEVRSLSPETEVSFVPMEAVGEYGGLDLSMTKQLGEVGNGYTYFRNGDVVVAKITPCFENGKGAHASGLANGIAFGTTELHVLRVAHELDDRFLFYLTLSDAFRRLGEADMYGAGGQKRISESFVENFRSPLPPIPEQRAIAAFLDRETAKIDASVAKKERLIELLQEKRAALITRAVTKGLDPNVPMKDSGVEWLGDVPRHWAVQRLKFLCDVHTGDKDTEDAIEGGQYPFFVRSQTVERINSMAFNCEAVLTAGDGVGVGKVFHYYKGAFDFHQRVYMMNNFRGVTGPFLFHFLRENFYKVALEGGAKSTVDSLRRPVFMNFMVCVPPRAEQEAIIAFLDPETAGTDKLVTKVHAAINRLKELRTALISAAVTGRIDVREEAP
ncbi:MAG TPA: restriction endonuclease subunit S [Xanthobacteraceae bacterium]|nr:restriction endonuclease subunit S [Xanthobacteraceae bacterium]